MSLLKILLRSLGLGRRQRYLPKGMKTYVFAQDKSAKTRTVLADRLATRHLETAQARSAEVSDLAASLRLKLENNHFEETIRRAMS